MNAEVQMMIIFLVASFLSILYLLRLLEKKESDFADTLLDLREINEALLLDKEYSRQMQAEKDELIYGLQVHSQQMVEEIESVQAEARKQKGRAQSAHTSKGQILEKWTPFLTHKQIDPHWRAEDWSFLGQPIDYVVFDWHKDKQKNLAEGKIVLLDVKAAKSQLTTKQRRIRDLIVQGSVEWREIRLD
jgi:predicted Holliday junction resolvase-like endonuclease